MIFVRTRITDTRLFPGFFCFILEVRPALFYAALEAAFYFQVDDRKRFADRLRELERLRKRGYSPEEIAALLSDSQWLGNRCGNGPVQDMQLSGLLPEDDGCEVRQAPEEAEESRHPDI